MNRMIEEWLTISPFLLISELNEQKFEVIMVFSAIGNIFLIEKASFEEFKKKVYVFCNRSVHPPSFQKRSTISISIKTLELSHKRTTVATKLVQYRFFEKTKSCFAKYFKSWLMLFERNLVNMNYSWAMPNILCMLLRTVSSQMSTLPFFSQQLLN